MVSGVIKMLICKTYKSWENQLQQHLQLLWQILLPRPWRLRPHDPRQCSINCSSWKRVHMNVQHLKTGPHELGEDTPTERHAGLEAWRWQPHQETYPGKGWLPIKGTSWTTPETLKKKKQTITHNDNKHDGKRFREPKVATWNVRGIVEKTEELQTELHKRKINIAIITQTKKGGEKKKDQRI